MTLHPFDELMELDSEQIRIDCAALHLARDAYPALNMFGYLAMLDDIAADVLAQRPKHTAVARYIAMRDVLVGERRLTGNRDDYYDPDNSYLNRVLESGAGIPISLSIIWIEVARRLEWPVSGVGFPGHFLVRFDDLDRTVLADPFNDGQSLDAADCQKLLDQQFEGKVKLTTELLNPADSRSIVGRLLHNLRAIYASSHRWTRLDDVLQRLIAVEPDNATHRQELAALRCRQGQFSRAYSQLTEFAKRRPEFGSDESVQMTLRRIEAAMAQRN